jgi:glycosyltransferase involved in cell wall biosynthesis
MSAARRAAGLTRYLTELGHRVTVLTSVMGGSGPVAHATRTVRTRDLMVSPLNWRRGNLAALQGSAGAGPVAAPSAIAAWTVPDLQLVGWSPFALPRALGLARHRAIDCVITTSPPASAHLVGLALQARGIPWVADFRDGWTFESQRPAWGTPALGALDRALERLVATRADAVSAVTPPIADDLARRFGRPVQTVTNGFDPGDDDAAPPPEGAAERDPARRTLVHTGTLSYGGRPLAPLIAGVRALREAEPSAAERLSVVLIGPATEAEHAEVRDAGVQDTIRFAGSVDHAAAVAAQRDADGLLVITGPGQSGVATGKLFEYLSTGRPILVIGDDTAAATIVRDAGAGRAVDRDDPQALAAMLKELALTPDALPHPSDEAVAAFSYPALAGQMAELVEQAIAHRRSDSAR